MNKKRLMETIGVIVGVCILLAVLFYATMIQPQNMQDTNKLCWEWKNGNMTMTIARADILDTFYAMGVINVTSGPIWRYNENTSECKKWVRIEE